MTASDAIDLDRFCSEDRIGLKRPFSIGEYTYATNGHVAVRVLRREGAEFGDIAINTLFSRADFNGLRLAIIPPGLSIPESTTTTIICAECNGGGMECHCASCSCECETCNGTGRISAINGFINQSIDINGVPFNAAYTVLIAMLPALMIPQKVNHNAAMPFTFDGGSGLLMPLRHRLAHHIETPVVCAKKSPRRSRPPDPHDQPARTENPVSSRFST